MKDREGPSDRPFVITRAQAEKMAGKIHFEWREQIRCPHCNKELTIAGGYMRNPTDAPS